MTEYNVALRTLVGPSSGAITWSSFESSKAFDEWYAETMDDGSDRPLSEVYEVVERDVTPERAVELHSRTPSFGG